jgi:mRNA interferase RelE/StbE
MQIVFLKAFSKDIDKLNNKQVASDLLEVISEIRTAKNIHHINNLEKLSGHSTAFRIKIKDYRIGAYIEKKHN